jgi:hypothetical protein
MQSQEGNLMQRLNAVAVLVAACFMLMLNTTTQAQEFQADLSGAEEVPAISTPGAGTFAATLDTSTGTMSYTLSYHDLAGEVTQAHIHFGQPNVSGGISVFLCTNLGNAPSPTVPACPPAPAPVPGQMGPASASVSGQIGPADVIGPGSQGVAAGDFDALLTAMNSGLAYANVHSMNAGTIPENFNGGEIRGQIQVVSTQLPVGNARVRCRVRTDQSPTRMRIQIDIDTPSEGTYVAKVTNQNSGAIAETETGKERTVAGPTSVDLDFDSTADSSDSDSFISSTFANPGNVVQAEVSRILPTALAPELVATGTTTCVND